MSLLAFVFAVGAMAMSYGVATRRGQTPLVNLILSGVIVGSAIVKLCERYGSGCVPEVRAYVKRMKEAAQGA